MKITREQIEARIKGVEYIVTHGRMTLCFITLDNGFIESGESVCIDAAEFNSETGRQIAYDDAFDQLWGYFGFVAMEDAHRSKAAPQQIAA
jgi:hypothetical protein